MPDAALRKLRLARVRSQHLTDDTLLTTDVAGVVASVCALQAQAFDAARHQVRVRSSGLTAGAVDHAFDVERSVVRTWLMRGTLHLCAADDLRWLLDILGPNANRLGERRRVEVGLDQATCRRGIDVLRKALADGPMARRQIRDRLITSNVLREPVGQSLIHLLFHAATTGVICCGPRVGRDDSFVLLDDWVPQSDGPRGDAAMAELARRYLRAYGPATAADFAAWSGLPVGAARAGWAAVADQIVDFPGVIPGTLDARACDLGPARAGADREAPRPLRYVPARLQAAGPTRRRRCRDLDSHGRRRLDPARRPRRRVDRGRVATRSCPRRVRDRRDTVRAAIRPREDWHPSRGWLDQRVLRPAGAMAS